jgi:ABC-2 type transport system permease protein
MGLTMAGQMIFFAFFTGAYSMMSILTEQEEGTLARLFTTPTDRTAILAGKLLAVFLTVIVQGIFLMIFARFVFRVDWGQPGSMALALLGQVIAASGLGVLLISVVKNTNQGGPMLGGGLSVLGMLGGLFTVAVPNLPAFLSQISRFTPQGWVLEGWKLSLAGQSPASLLVPFAVMTAMGVLMFVLGTLKFRRRLA